MGNQPSLQQISFQIVGNKDEATAILQQAEQRDLYLAECRDNRTNAAARKTCSYYPNYVSFDESQRYADSCYRVRGCSAPDAPFRASALG